MTKLRIGTRGSDLARAQTELILQAISQLNPELQAVVCPIETLGDAQQGSAEAAVADKSKWVAEIEAAIVAEEVDVAVHSGKDVPHEHADGTMVLPVLSRNDARDAFIGRPLDGGGRIALADIPSGALVGTSSLRRRAQLARMRPDIEIAECRGNVPTRLRKLEQEGDFHGIILAAAGLKRLGFEEVGAELLDVEQMLPAMNQGILVAQFAEGRDDVRLLLESLVEIETLAVWWAERTCIGVLGADCYSAVAAYAQSDLQSVTLCCSVFSPDGKESMVAEGTDLLAQAKALGVRVGEDLLAQGAEKLLRETS